MSNSFYQLSVDIKDQLTVAQGACNDQLMVAKENLRQAFSLRLHNACDKAGIRVRGRAVDIQGELKRRGVHATTTAIGKWLNAEAIPEADKLRALARWLGIRAEWLEYGEGEMIQPEKAGDLASEPSNVLPAIQPTRLYRYPVVSEVQAGAWTEAVQPYAPGAEDHFELTDYKAKGPAFWLEVTGDSMTSPTRPSIPEGHFILVDTGLAPQPGDLVVAKLDTEEKATFKKLISDAGQLYLKPLNPAYRMIPIDGNCRLIGVVKEAKMKL